MLSGENENCTLHVTKKICSKSAVENRKGRRLCTKICIRMVSEDEQLKQPRRLVLDGRFVALYKCAVSKAY